MVGVGRVPRAEASMIGAMNAVPRCSTDISMHVELTLQGQGVMPYSQTL
jgi:hypothetical protein